MESLLEKTLIILAEFNDDYDYIPLTRGFIGDYFEHLSKDCRRLTAGRKMIGPGSWLQPLRF